MLISKKLSFFLRITYADVNKIRRFDLSLADSVLRAGFQLF